jgi:integrase
MNTNNNHSLTGFAEVLILETDNCNCKGTARAYHSTFNSLSGFMNGKCILFEEITPQLLCNYETYLKQKGLSRNSISFYMRNLRAILNKAASRELILPRQENLFSGVHTGTYETQKRALTEDEMHRLAALCSQAALPLPLYETLLYFLFDFCSCGMSFVDLAFLRKSDIHGSHIRYCRRKTGQIITVKITWPMRKIINYFSGITKNSPYVFPIIDPAKGNERRQYESALRQQNRHLKKLAAMAGIGKNISTHVSRHSWATIAKRRDITIALISECLGHRNEKTTITYLDSFGNERTDQASELISSIIFNPDDFRSAPFNIGSALNDFKLHKQKKMKMQKKMSVSIQETDT